jgi:GNAT superfamily N-acetyltransferase
MFRIRKIVDPLSGSNGMTVAEAVSLLKMRFAQVAPEEFDTLARKLVNPFKTQFTTQLFVAEDAHDRLRGAAVVLHAPDIRFLFLDYMAVPPGRSGAGAGGALYQHVREEATRLGDVGLFFECLPDDPVLCSNPEILKQNVQRLKFYERFGARPIIGTLYETPIRAGEDCPPYLVFDDVGSGKPLGRDLAKQVVRAILERKYSKLCPPYYVEGVVSSITDDPVRLRPFKYVRRQTVEVVRANLPPADVRFIMSASADMCRRPCASRRS